MSMDRTEDLSARILLRNILSTETPRTPVTRSSRRTPSTTEPRRSKRLSRKDAGAQTPRDILRRSLKRNVRESIARTSLPATTRRTTSGLSRKVITPGRVSMPFDDTPRHLLKNILQTEPVRSPVVHEKTETEEPSSTNSSISNHFSVELSGLDLPDLTIGNAGTIAKRLNRKRPQRILDVTGFAKRLQDRTDFPEDNEVSSENHSSLSFSSSSSLSLKTPFPDVQSERRGLQRKVSNRRKITEETFGAAVNKWYMGNYRAADDSLPVDVNKTSFSEGFTLGLSMSPETTLPDITTDVVNCNTALYPQPDVTTSSISVIATQDKATMMASQLQEQLRALDQGEREEENSVCVFPMEDGGESVPQNEEEGCEGESERDGAQCHREQKRTADLQQYDHMEQPEEEEKGAEPQEESAVHPQTKGGEVDSQDDDDKDVLESEEEEAAPHSEEEGGEEAAGVSQSDKEAEAESAVHSEEEGGEEAAGVSQSDKEAEAESAVHSEEEGGEEAAGVSQSDKEAEAESAVHSEEEDGEDAAGVSQSDEEEEAESAGHSEKQSDEEDNQPDEEVSQSEDLAESQSEGEHDDDDEEGQVEEEQLEHLSRRAHGSQELRMIPVTEAEENVPDTAGRTTADCATDLQLDVEGDLDGMPGSGTPDLAESLTEGQGDMNETEAEPAADEENSDVEMTHDIAERSGQSEAPAATADPLLLEGEWEEEEDDEDEEDGEELPLKTPAFVREKRTFFLPEPQVSPLVVRNAQSSSSTGDAAPAVKPKPAQRRRSRPSQKEARLPKSYLMSVFRHFAKTKVSPDIFPVLKETMDEFFGRLADDLETYANHAKRKTIEMEDALLLLKRQGHVNDKVPVEVLIEKYLRMEQRKLLIPIATSGNVVVPKKRR